MSLSRRPSGKPLAFLAALAILAACNVSDSSPQEDPSGTALFAPRLQAPAEGLRRADFMKLQVWKRNAQVVYEFHNIKDSILLSDATVSMTVPRKATLKYLLVGYVVTLLNGVPTVDTVWTAADSGFTVDSDVPTRKKTTNLIRNWAVSPTTQTSSSTTLKPGSTVEFRADSGQTVAVGSDANVSCVGASDSVVRIRALLSSPMTVWVRACGTGTLPSTPRQYSWINDTTGITGQRTPLAPSPSGGTGFADLDRLPIAESDPTAPIAFSTSQAGDVIAWAFKVLDKSVVPDSTNFPPAPRSKALAPRTSTNGLLDVWSVVKDSLATPYPTGMTVLVTAMRIDTGLGVEWPSAPTRFWFTVTPPEAPTRFRVVPQGWDSLVLDWSLSNSALRYSAWYDYGSGTPDSARAKPIPAAATSSPVWVLHSLPSDTMISVVVKTTDPRTGLSTLTLQQGQTGKLPALPTAFMTKPNTNPATLKVMSLDSIWVALPKDSAGRSVKIRYATSTKLKSDTPNPGAQSWPDLSSPSVTSTSSLSPDGHLFVSARPGEYLYISYVAEDSLGRRAPSVGTQLIEVVADDVDVPPPAPTGLRLLARTESSLLVAWDTLAGFSYQIRWSVNGVRATEQALDSNRFLIRGLPAGTPVESISVKSIQIGNGTRFSGYSTALQGVRTKRPPAPLTEATAFWVMDGTTLKLRIRWTREVGTTEQRALAGVSSISETPSLPEWIASVGSNVVQDSLDAPYTLLQGKPFVAFGRRVTRDSIEVGPLWTHVRIPSLAPAIHPDSLRIWQFGSLLKVTAPQAPEAFGFQLRVRVLQASTNLDTIYTIQRGVGELKLGAGSTGTLGARFWWERTVKEGMPRFDKGDEFGVGKNILPAPSDFQLRPGSTENSWIVLTPTDIRADAKVILVRTKAGVLQKPEEVVSGREIQASVADNETFQITQVFEIDTSDFSPRHPLQTLGNPIASHPPGSYLFQFPIVVSAISGTGSTVQVRQSGGSWLDYLVPFNPHEMASPEARLVGPFSVGAAMPLDYVEDSTFNAKEWEVRVKSAGPKGWVDARNLFATYVGAVGTSFQDAYIKLAQDNLDSTGEILFPIDAVRGSTIDLNGAAAISVGAMKISTSTNVSVVLDLESTGGDLSIILPTTPKSTGLGYMAPLSGSTAVLPLLSKGGSTSTITWTDLGKYLKNVKGIGLTVRGADRITMGSLNLTSLRIVPLSGR